MIKRLIATNKKKLAIILAVFLFLTAGAVAIGVNAEERVVIENSTNPQLEYLGIYDSESHMEAWKPTGSYAEAAGKYTLISCSWAQWYTGDSLHFAYKKYKFNFGKTSMLTVTTQLDSWNGMKAEAGAGLMFRSSLKSSAATLMLHARPGCIMVTYRAADKGDSIKGKEVTLSLQYPVQFKAELGSNKITCYYMQSGGKIWVKIGTFPFVNTNPDVYVGLCAYSQDKDYTATAKFTGLNVVIDALEGYTSGDSGSSGETDSDEPEEEVVLPEDIPVGQNVLLSETFTDGSLKNTPESPTNWLWKYYQLDDPEIFENKEFTNRYLYDWNAQSRYYYAGDEHWTDYEYSMDMTFTGDYSDDAANAVYLYTRHTSIAQYGFYDYIIYLKSTKGAQSINLGIRQHAGSRTTPPTNLISVPFTYLPKVGEEDVHISIKIVAFDNKITTYLNGSDTPIIDAKFDNKIATIYTQGNTEATKVTVGEAGIVNTEGCIGFMTDSAAVQIDNIRVTKLEDYLGGDFDNKIGGNWETSIENEDHYLSEYIENKWIH